MSDFCGQGRGILMSESLTYRQAGVDIDAGNELVSKLKKIVKLTDREGVLGGLGGFGGCFDLSTFRYEKPVLVASTDGVGTKLRLAIDLGRYEGVGIDLVAMCVNDLVVMGAEPLFFLDYYATGKLEVDVAEAVITGIAKGCQEANAALIGGETAEMPGMYASKDFDLAGFCVGIVEKDQVINGSNIAPDDVLIGLASSGPHSNGYSLIRHILKTNQIPLTESLEGLPLSQRLLTPTRIYVKSLLSLVKANLLKGAAHITGGGFIDNIPRILPDNCCAFVDTQSWQLPTVFSWLQTQAKLSDYELRRTFNCGVGMVVCVSEKDVKQALALLREQGESPWVMGNIVPRKHPEKAIEFSDE